MKGLNLKKHCPQFPWELSETGQSRFPKITPEPRQHSHLSHDSIPFYGWDFIPITSSQIPLFWSNQSLMLTVYLQYVRWRSGRGLSRKTHLSARGAKTWAAAFSGVFEAQCCGWEARRRPWCEGHNGWHFKSEEGQQAIQLKGSCEQCHVSQITPKSLWFQLKRHVLKSCNYDRQRLFIMAAPAKIPSSSIQC